MSAMQEGKLTALFELYEKPLGSTKLTQQTQATFAHDSTSFSRSQPNSNGSIVWVVYAKSLKLLWSCFEQDGDLVTR